MSISAVTAFVGLCLAIAGGDFGFAAAFLLILIFK